MSRILLSVLLMIMFAVAGQAQPSSSGTATSIAPNTPISSGTVRATGGTTARTLSAITADLTNVKSWGAVGDAKGYPTGTMTAGSPTLTDASNTPFLPTDCAPPGIGCTGTVNKSVMVDGAGASGAPLSTTITGYTSSSIVTLAANASVAVPYYYVADAYFAVAPPAIATPQSGSGSYAPGDTITLTGGTASTQGVLTVTATQLVSATVAAAGSGGTTGACILTGTTGTSAVGPGFFTINATITGGAISALGSITSAGQYTANPSNLAAEPVTSNCSLTGATLTLKMGVLGVHVTTLGNYSVFPTNPIAQGSTSGSGTGATFTLGSAKTGSYTYGTDDSAVISAALTYANSLPNGQRPGVYFPGGAYYMKGTSTPLITSPLSIIGDGPHATQFVLDASYSGDLFAASEVWSKSNYINGMAPTEDSSGLGIRGFSVIGNMHTTGVQNAIALYDRNDYARISDIEVNFLHGQALSVGSLKNQTQGYMRESRIGDIRAQFCGTSSLPCIRLSSNNTSGSFSDSTNEVNITNINIFNAASSGFVVDNVNNTYAATRFIRVQNLRVESSLNGDNIDIGLASNTGQTGDVGIWGLQSVNSPAGFWGLNIADNSSGHNYAILVDGIEMSGAAGTGGGINVADGQQMQFIVNTLTSGGYCLKTATSTTVPYAITFNWGSSEASCLSNIGTVGIVKSPTWQNKP